MIDRLSSPTTVPSKRNKNLVASVLGGLALLISASRGAKFYQSEMGKSYQEGVKLYREIQESKQNHLEQAQKEICNKVLDIMETELVRTEANLNTRRVCYDPEYFSSIEAQGQESISACETALNLTPEKEPLRRINQIATRDTFSADIQELRELNTVSCR